MDDAPVFDQVNLVTADMAATVAFYRRLGVSFPAAEPPWDAHHQTAVSAGTDFDVDSTHFAAKWDVGWRGAPRPVLGFRVKSRDAVDTIYADLTGAGYHGQQPPYDAFWGARYAVVEDPDGNPVGIMSPRDPGMRSEPPTL